MNLLKSALNSLRARQFAYSVFTSKNVFKLVLGKSKDLTNRLFHYWVRHRLMEFDEAPTIAVMPASKGFVKQPALDWL